MSHHVLEKDRLIREARWDERSRHMGSELRDHTLGVIGFGLVGPETSRRFVAPIDLQSADGMAEVRMSRSSG